MRVFGYYPEDVSTLMEELQRCGYIANIRSTASNYMFVQYYTQLEVEKAMTLNGTRVCGHYIGVVRCNREDVGEAPESELNQNRSSYLDRR